MPVPISAKLSAADGDNLNRSAYKVNAILYQSSPSPREDPSGMFMTLAPGNGDSATISMRKANQLLYLAAQTSLWQPFPFLTGWSGTLRYRLFHNNLMMQIVGTAEAATPPPRDVLVPIGTLLSPYVPAQPASLPALVADTQGQGVYVQGGMIEFKADGTVNVAVTSLSAAGLVICGIIPLD